MNEDLGRVTTAPWERCCDTLADLMLSANLADATVVDLEHLEMTIVLSGNQVWALSQVLEFAVLNAGIDWPSR